MNVVEPLLYQCKINPFATALGVAGSGLSSIKFGQLEKYIDRAARFALNSGLGSGQVVNVAVTDSILNLVLVLALTRLGIATMSVFGEAATTAVKIDATLSDDANFKTAGKTSVAVDAGCLEAPGDPVDYGRYDKSTELSACRLDWTGTHFIAVNHRMLIDRINQYSYVTGGLLTRCSRVFCGFPANSWRGVNCALHALSRGAAIYLANDQPSTGLQDFDLFQIQGFLSPPEDLDALLKLLEANEELDCSMEVIVSEGVGLTNEIVQRSQRICTHLYETYGSLEAGVVASGPAALTTGRAGTVGFPCPGVKIEIVDEAGRVVSPQQTGRLRISSPWLASGYMNDTRESRRRFRQGAFESNDLGHIAEDGSLVVSKRDVGAA